MLTKLILFLATTVDQKKIKLSGPTQKYKALYQFDARNDDELSLLPGDFVMVNAQPRSGSTECRS